MKNKNKAKGFGILLFTTLMSGTFSAAAHNNIDNTINGKPVLAGQAQQPDHFLNDLVVRSDLVFQGKLIDISERLSIEKIPYTFVTYEVEEVILGRYSNNTITLKYVGGEFANGNRLSASNSPKVTLGENAILMVQQSRDTGCDFVDCEKGRFLLRNGKVIGANESAIVVENGQLNYIALAQRNASKKVSHLAKSTIPAFVAHLKVLDKTRSRQINNPRAEAFDINKRAPFKAYAALTQAQKAPDLPKEIANTGVLHKKPRQLKGSQFDLWEAQQLKLNGGDPLLNSNNNK
ncbi:MAG: hypothetical protein MJK04_32365 [Psychrosphaera sp.]|nr:hypothetical protein [Psychrosphaera sp.]